MAKNAKKSHDEVVAAVKNAQLKWAEALRRGDCTAITELYAKSGDNWVQDLRSNQPGCNDEPATPTCALVFNPTLEDKILTTWSLTQGYFKGTNENPGFAKKVWTQVYFDPNQHPKVERFITVTDEGAVAVGRYVFEGEDLVKTVTDEYRWAVTRLTVDYTFVYKFFGGELKIIAHHSSLPLSQKQGK